MASDEWVTRSIRIPAVLDAKLKRIAEREMSNVQREVIIAVRAHVDAEERRVGKGK